MRDVVEGKVSKEEIKEAKKQAKTEEKTFAQSFWSGFTLPIRLIFKGIWIILWPIRWVLRKIMPKYFKNSYLELKQVTWPSTKDTLRLTFAVIVFSAVFTLIITAVDFVINKLFKEVILK